MAFTANITANGRNYPAAYIKTIVRYCDAQRTVVQLQLWESQEIRNSNAESLPYSDDLRSFNTDLSLHANNPIEYAYKLLENSGEFPNASWNV